MSAHLSAPTAQPLDDIITDVDLDNYRGARRLLREAIPQAVAAGHSGNQIAARLAGVFGQQAVINYVTALRTVEKVRDALARAGLQSDVAVFATGPDSPLGAWVALAADPGSMDVEAYEGLPGRIRDVLAPLLLTTDPAVDANLLDGQRVLVHKVRPAI